MADVDRTDRALHSTIRLQNAALFCLSCMGKPQATIELQAKGCILEKPVHRFGELTNEDFHRHFGGSEQHHFPAYTLSVVVALKKEACTQSKQPVFQALLAS
jgi:hypothetical protein